MNLELATLSPELLDIDTSFKCRRRGAEMKIIAAEQTADPDQTLIRALRNAHSWVGQMKAGLSVKQISVSKSVAESYVTRILVMAFLSPKIQSAIMDGSHPVALTLETITRSKLPMDWQAQERLLGFDQNG